MVAVRMVREGVDVPRLAVGVYATAIATPLFFAQAVGRFVRARSARRDRVGVPAVGAAPARASPPRWRSSATTCSGAGSPTRPTSSPPSRTCSPQANADVGASDELEGTLQALGLAGPLRPRGLRRRRVRPRGRGARRVGGGDGLPRHPRACSSPTRCASCSTTASVRVVRRPTAERGRRARGLDHEQLAILRRELNGLVAAWHHRTGQAHGVTHAALRKELGGPRRRDRERRAAPRPDQPPARVGVAAYRVAAGSRARAPAAGRGVTSRGRATRWPSVQCSSAWIGAPQSRWVNATGGPSGSAR